MEPPATPPASTATSQGSAHRSPPPPSVPTSPHLSEATSPTEEEEKIQLEEAGLNISRPSSTNLRRHHHQPLSRQNPGNVLSDDDDLQQHQLGGEHLPDSSPAHPRQAGGAPLLPPASRQQQQQQHFPAAERLAQQQGVDLPQQQHAVALVRPPHQYPHLAGGHHHHHHQQHHHNHLPPPPLSTGCEDHWSWNKHDKSHEVRLFGPKQRIAHFHPNWSNGTAGVRGTRVLNGGRYYWEINVSQRIFGTSMMFGIGNKRARLHVDAFVNMLGEDNNSWGLSHKGLLWHGGLHKQYVKCFKENIATTIGLYFDGISGTLTYFKDNVCLGVAFSGLNEVAEPLYPIVCSTAAKTEMALGVLKRDFVNLQDRCRATILSHLTHEEQIDQLRLPLRIKQYISEGLENFQEDVALAVNNQMSHW